MSIFDPFGRKRRSLFDTDLSSYFDQSDSYSPLRSMPDYTRKCPRCGHTMPYDYCPSCGYPRPPLSGSLDSDSWFGSGRRSRGMRRCRCGSLCREGEFCDFCGRLC